MLFVMFAMAMTLAMIIATAVALHSELTGRERAAVRSASRPLAKLRALR